MELGRDPDMRRNVPKNPLLAPQPKLRVKTSAAGEQHAKNIPGSAYYFLKRHLFMFHVSDNNDHHNHNSNQQQHKQTTATTARMELCRTRPQQGMTLLVLLFRDRTDLSLHVLVATSGSPTGLLIHTTTSTTNDHINETTSTPLTPPPTPTIPPPTPPLTLPP